MRGSDIIIGINEKRIRNGDEMSSYLGEYTLPGETIMLGVFRTPQTVEIPVILGKRPPPPA